jgi:hypothetical protein
MKIALYSCNFGNYRNEFNNYYDMKFDNNIDYYLFTDNILTEEQIARLQKWKVCNISVLPTDSIMDGNRWTSKYIKFILPEILQAYDIIIWIDNKILNTNRFKNRKILKNVTLRNITQIINKYKSYNVFNIKHPDNKTMQEELILTMQQKIENIDAGCKFLQHIEKYVSKFDLPDTCIIIRKNNSETNKAFEYCFELMKKYGLKRDQNIYNYALDEKNITPMLLNFMNI